ncbi:immunity protein Imm2, partial [Pseudomonas aeruginosa]|nr:immunity protein Imm2 [Pseudomonas aeruginosa]
QVTRATGSPSGPSCSTRNGNSPRWKRRHKKHGRRDNYLEKRRYSELENSFDLPIEKLMLEVLALILSAGRSSDKVKRYHLDVIHGLLKEIKLSSVLDDLPSDEAAELRDDLRVLGLY